MNRVEMKRGIRHLVRGDGVQYHTLDRVVMDGCADVEESLIEIDELTSKSKQAWARDLRNAVKARWFSDVDVDGQRDCTQTSAR